MPLRHHVSQIGCRAGSYWPITSAHPGQSRAGHWRLKDWLLRAFGTIHPAALSLLGRRPTAITPRRHGARDGPALGPGVFRLHHFGPTPGGPTSRSSFEAPAEWDPTFRASRRAPPDATHGAWPGQPGEPSAEPGLQGWGRQEQRRTEKHGIRQTQSRSIGDKGGIGIRTPIRLCPPKQPPIGCAHHRVIEVKRGVATFQPSC